MPHFDPLLKLVILFRPFQQKGVEGYPLSMFIAQNDEAHLPGHRPELKRKSGYSRSSGAWC